MAKKLINDKANGLHVSIDNLPELELALKHLASLEVLVGVPDDKSDRPVSGMTNAALAYIHDNGEPASNIPARPFMRPGMDAVLPQTTEILSKAAGYALKGDRAKVEEGFNRVGQIAVDSIRRVIGAGIPPPLAQSTLERKAAKGRKGAKIELGLRAKGHSPAMLLGLYVTPLVDTGEMRKSISYVVRKKKDRKP